MLCRGMCKILLKFNENEDCQLNVRKLMNHISFSRHPLNFPDFI